MEEARKYEEYDIKRKEAINAKSKLLQYVIELQNKYPNFLSNYENILLI